MGVTTVDWISVRTFFKFTVSQLTAQLSSIVQSGGGNC